MGEIMVQKSSTNRLIAEGYLNNLPANWYKTADPYIDAWVAKHNFSLMKGVYDYHLRKIFWDDDWEAKEYIDIAAPNAEGKYMVTPIGPKSFRQEQRLVNADELPETLDWALKVIQDRRLKMK